MRKFKIFALMLCIATFGLTTSCTKDDAEKSYKELIVGKWRQTNLNSEFFRDRTYDFTKEGYVFVHTVYSDPAEQDADEEGKYSIEGDKLLFYCREDDGSYSDDNSWDKYTIITLVENHLTVRHVVEGEDYDVLYRFERI